MPYVPGDNWIICDLSGKKILMSKSVKTWDGLRVDPAYWYPKHPQLSIRSVPDHMAVKDARPRPKPIYVVGYGSGTFTLTSPNGTNYIVYVDTSGHLVTIAGTLGSPVPYFSIDGYALVVTDGGVLHVIYAPVPGPPYWMMADSNGLNYKVTLIGISQYYGIGVLYGTGHVYGFVPIVVTLVP